MLLYAAATVLIALTATGLVVRRRLRVPARRYEGRASVGSLYDQWTSDGMVESYWGEHFHAGYYGDPPLDKDFVVAKNDLIDEVIKRGIGKTTLPERPGAGLVRMLDVGCGLGGSARRVAKRWPKTAHVTGVNISKAQIARATALTRAQQIRNAVFLECDALHLSFPEKSFDVVWAIESEPYMPDKALFVREMVRVLKPGGRLVIVCWNVRDTRDAPLSNAEREHLRLLVDQWCHAGFISIREYVEMFEESGLVEVVAENWTAATQPSWRAGILAPFGGNPLNVIKTTLKRPWAQFRDVHMLLRFEDAFRNGLCEYGVICGRKP